MRKKDKRKSCILVLLTVRFIPRDTDLHPRRAPPHSPPSASPSNVNPVAAISPFYKATLFRLRLRGSENSGLCPTRGWKKQKKTLRNNEAMLLQGEMWTESSPCRPAGVLHQGRAASLNCNWVLEDVSRYFNPHATVDILSFFDHCGWTNAYCKNLSS